MIVLKKLFTYFNVSKGEVIIYVNYCFNGAVYYHISTDYYFETVFLGNVLTPKYPILINGKKYETISKDMFQFLNDYKTFKKPLIKRENKFYIGYNVDENIDRKINNGEYKKYISINNVDINKLNEEQLELNINTNIELKNINELYIFIDSDNHYPFEYGVNAKLFYELI